MRKESAGVCTWYVWVLSHTHTEEGFRRLSKLPSSDTSFSCGEREMGAMGSQETWFSLIYQKRAVPEKQAFKLEERAALMFTYQQSSVRIIPFKKEKKMCSVVILFLLSIFPGCSVKKHCFENAVLLQVCW